MKRARIVDLLDVPFGSSCHWKGKVPTGGTKKGFTKVKYLIKLFGTMHFLNYLKQDAIIFAR